MTAAPDVVIIGSGFAGIGMGVQLKRAGFDSFVILERGPEVGGTWRSNTYPGCACDVPSHLYSFSYEKNPEWSRMYPTQVEIWDYLKAVTVRPDAQEAFNATLVARAKRTVFSTGCKSWYLDERGESPVLWPGFSSEYWWKARRVRMRDFVVT